MNFKISANNKSSLLNKVFSPDNISGVSIMGMRGGMLLAKFMLSLFIARFMGLEDLGVYGLIITINGSVQAVIKCGVFNTLSRQIVYESKNEILINLRNYTAGILLAYLILTPIAITIGWHLEMTLLFTLGMIVMILEHAAFDIFALANNLQRPKLANVLLTAQSAMWIYVYMAVATYVPALRNLESLMCFWISGGIIMMFCALLLSRRWPWKEMLRSKIDFSWYNHNIRRSSHLYMGELISVFNQYADRYLIGFFLNLEILGVYVLFSQITNAIHNLVHNGVIQIIKPRLILAFKNTNANLFHELFKKGIYRIFAGAFLVSLISAVIIPFAIPHTNQTLAINYIPLFWLMLLTNLIRIGDDTVKTYLYVTHQDRLILHSNTLGLVLYIILGPPALYFLGIWGTSLTSAVVFISTIIYANSLKIKVSQTS